jgi:hypothetical protein
MSVHIFTSYLYSEEWVDGGTNGVTEAILDFLSSSSLLLDVSSMGHPFSHSWPLLRPLFLLHILHHRLPFSFSHSLREHAYRVLLRQPPNIASHTRCIRNLNASRFQLSGFPPLAYPCTTL